METCRMSKIKSLMDERTNLSMRLGVILYKLNTQFDMDKCKALQKEYEDVLLRKLNLDKEIYKLMEES